MLVLGVKVGQSVSIGSDITVMVTMIRGNYVRLGIAAPRELPIARENIKHWPRDNDDEEPAKRV